MSGWLGVYVVRVLQVIFSSRGDDGGGDSSGVGGVSLVLVSNGGVSRIGAGNTRFFPLTIKIISR